MAYCKHPLGPVPDDTARAMRSLTRNGKRFLTLATLLDGLFDGVDIEAVYPKAGQWGIHPVRMMVMMVLQAMEGVSDKQAAEATAVNIGWKALLHLSIEHPGFDSSVFSEFRDKLLAVDATTVFLDTILQKARELGLLNTDKQRSDSTSIEACVKSLNRTELILETVRNVLEEISDEDPAWLVGVAKPQWRQTYYLARPFSYRLPKAESKRVQMANSAASDGKFLLAKMEKQRRTDLLSLKSVQILQQVLEQQFSDDDRGNPKLKDANLQPPAAERTLSPHEPDARVATKDGVSYVGYKAHITETCSKESPRLITQVQVERPSINDSLTLEKLVNDLIRRGLKPLEMLLDSGYVNIDLFYHLENKLNIKPISPLRNGHSWQSKTENGIDQSKFEIDWKRKTAICPKKKRSIQWKEKRDYVSVSFSPTDCAICPLRSLCTKSAGRVLRLKPQKIYQYMEKHRRWQETQKFKKQYSIRSGIEGTHSQLVRRGGRRMTVKSTEKVSLKLILTASAHNLARIVDFMHEKATSLTRVGKFEKLMTA